MKIRFCHDLRKRSERNNVAVRFRDRNDFRVERQKTNLSFKGGVKQHSSIFSRRLDGTASLHDGIGLASIVFVYPPHMLGVVFASIAFVYTQTPC